MRRLRSKEMAHKIQSILGVGNAVVDHTILADLSKPLVDGDPETLIPLGSSILTTDRRKQKLLGIARDRARSGVGLSALGGCALSSVRVAAKWLEQENSLDRVEVMYLGAVGNDANGALIRVECEKVNVRPLLIVDEVLPTGECAIFVDTVSRERSICCSRGASEALTREKSEPLLSNKPSFVFSSCFTLTTEERFQVVKWLADSAGSLAMSLSSPQLLQNNPVVRQRLELLLPQTKLLFGTKEELHSLFPSSTAEEEVLASMLCHKLAGPESLCVITDGPRDVLVANQKKSDRFPVYKIAAAEIVDTNGCGDAFAGGFLAAYCQSDQEDWTKWVEAGSRCAFATLQTHGVNVYGPY